MTFLLHCRTQGVRSVTRSLLALVNLLATFSVAALNPSCAPGGNFDLTIWSLELPIGQTNSPKVVAAPALKGCQGFSDSQYFYTGSDGAMTMNVPGDPATTGCVKWAESSHCRTELKQVSPATWDPKASANRMSATLAVAAAGGQTCIGQVFIDDGTYLKPVCELYYWDSGRIAMGVAQTRAGGNQILFDIGIIPLGQTFSYEIRYEKNELMVRLNGGSFVPLPTYELNAPRSFFKIGNYLQGKSASMVKFYSINVDHTGTAAPTWPPAGAIESPRVGIGPFNILTAISRTISTETQPTNTPGDCTGAPPIVDNVLNFRQYTDANCCQTFQTMKLGTLDSCHDAGQPIGSFTQAVGQTMFGRNIQIYVYEGIGCEGDPESFHLTNQAGCWTVTEANARWRSFKISATASGGGEPEPAPACDVITQPDNRSDDWAMSLNLYGESCCDAPVQTTRIGALGVCHKSIAPFRDFTQTVGQNMFGRDIKIRTFTDDACRSEAYKVTSLTNVATCYHKDGDKYQSFMLSGPGGTTDPDTGSPGCSIRQPTNTDDYTLTLNLYATSCCDAPVQTIKLGTLGKCQKATRQFQDITMAVGQQMFNRNIKVRMWAGDACAGTPTAQLSLTNKETCHSPGDSYWSFMIGEAADTTPAPTCDATVNNGATGGNDYTATLQFFRAGDCCKAFQNMRIGKLGDCHDTNAPFASWRQSVGQELFGKGNKIVLYTGSGCGGSAYVADLTNKALCWVGVTFRSIKIEGPATPAPPPPPTTPSCGGRLNTPNTETLAVTLYKEAKCCTKAWEFIVGGLQQGNGFTSWCIKPGYAFYGVMESVGTSLFGKGNQVRLFEDGNCGSGSWHEVSLTNANVCWMNNGRAWRSLQVGDFTAPPPPPPPPPVTPPKIKIHLGYLHATTFGDPPITRMIMTAWAEGTDECRGPNLSTYPANWCGKSFCVGGQCGFTQQGCGSSGGMWINLNGAWYSNCHAAYKIVKSCDAVVFFGDAVREHICDQF